MRLIAAALLALTACPLAAQEAAPDGVPDGVPDRRVAISRDVDFYGSDLSTLLDVTLDACQAACLADESCVAFTFNQRNASCFPKSALGEATPFAGGISGRILDTDPAVLASAPARAAEMGFLEPWQLDAAEDLGREIGRMHSSDESAPESLLASAADAEARGDRLLAFRLTGAALALTDDPATWRAYARLALSMGTEGDEAAARGRALPAAIAAALRSEAPARGEALMLLAGALEAEGLGRAAIPAVRLALRESPGPEVEAALDRVVGLYGFNVVETQVDSDAAIPRACVLFNEALRPGFDYSPYVRVADAALTVTARDAQLCVEGAEHGQRLEVTLREGLPAASGEALARPIPLSLQVRDRAPAVRVLSRAYVLPRGPGATLPIESVNLSDVDLRLARVSDANLLRTLTEGQFGAPVYGWDLERFDTDLGTPVWEGSVAVSDAPLNRDVVTEVPVGEALAGQPPGLYALTALAPDQDLNDRPATSQWFVLSDLGIATFAGTDGLTVAVRGLSDAGAVAGAEVTLMSRAGAVLGVAATDSDGIARFAPGLTRGEGGEAPALVTVTTGDPQAPGDLAFLSLMDAAFDLSDRGVEGREAPGPVDAFLTTDRGAYRAGETVHATALVRDEAARAVAGLPLTAVLTRPDGVESARATSAQDAAGGHVFAFDVAPNAPRGTWRLAVTLDPEAGEPLAETPLLVEDFLPERLDFDLALDGEARLGAALPVALAADYLFGAPAGDLGIEGEATVAAVATLEAFPGFVFGLHDAPFEARTEGFGGDRTGADGAASLQVPLPAPEGAVPQPLEARVTARVLESSGRPVERRLTVPLPAEGPFLGLRVPAEVPEGGFAEVAVLGLAPDLTPIPMNVRWRVERLDTRYQWYEVEGFWNWEPLTRRVRVAEGEVALDGTGPATLRVPVEWGEHEVVVERVDGPYAAASTTFAAGWANAAAEEPAPDRLAVALDAATYAPGDVATLRIAAEGPGTALVTVLTSRVVAMEVVELSGAATEVRLPVTEEWGPGAYVAAQLIRPLEGRAAGQGREPVRALGLAHAAVDPGDRLLGVTLEAPLEADPRGPLTVAVEVADLAPGEAAFVTLAAVDAGILNLTGFEPPDPAAHVLGQRALGVELRDLYGRLIEPGGGALGALREGGDAQTMTLRAEPPTEALLAFFEGPVAVDAEGRAEVTFDLPAFNGTVRVMAVAWSARGVGSAAADVQVADPVVLTASLPRALAPGDASRIRLELTHAEGPAGAVPVEVAAPGLDLGGSATLTADLAPQGTWRQDVPFTAPQAGPQGVTVSVTTPDGRRLDRSFVIPVEARDPEVARTLRFALNPGESFTFDDAALAGFVPGTAEATLSVGPLARLDAAGLLARLDAVPWGCTEQVASQALPLLYLADVAQAAGLAPTEGVSQRIEDAVALILANQASNGSFGLWSPGSGDLWLDAYVTDVLARIRAAGFEVPDGAFGLAVDNLRNEVAYQADFESGGEGLAYALLILAREGEALVGDLRYFADARADAFATPLALGQLGAALAQYGDQPRADRLFALAQARLDAEADDPAVWRVDYGTLRRDEAAILALAVEAGSGAVDRDALAASLAARDGPASTQEAAWQLLAAAALAGDLRGSGVTVDGAPPEGATVLRTLDGAAPRRVANDGTGPLDLTLTVLGVPEGEVPAGGTGWQVERAAYSMEGEAVALDEVAAGTRLVMVLTVRPVGYQAARLMVTDPLPGGFEIDNPNLLAGGDVAALPWLAPVAAAHAEFRADRFLAAVDWQGDQPFQLAYVVRAVTPGDYRHPAASVEDMYRPAMRGQSAAGRVAVVE